MCSPCKVCGDHAKRHAASVVHPRRGGEEDMKEKVELLMNEVCVLICPPAGRAISNTKANHSPLEVALLLRNLTTRV